MNEHPSLWLDAYLDGELPVGKALIVEAHLAECADCRALLAQRRDVMRLLQEAEPANGLKPAGRFVAEVELHLSRPRLPERRKPMLSLLWQFAPLALILAWVFVMAVSIAGTVLAFFPDPIQALAGSLPALQESSHLAVLFDSGWGRLALEGIDFLGPFNILDWSWLTSLAARAGIGFLYLGWLASWLASHNQHTIIEGE